jgi:hypothetical protein
MQTVANDGGAGRTGEEKNKEISFSFSFFSRTEWEIFFD